MSTLKKLHFPFLVIFAAILSLCSMALFADDDKKGRDDKRGNIIRKIVSAPVVTNGLVAGAPTEFNIILKAKDADVGSDLDPKKFGYQIPAGGRMEIELSGTYKRNVDSSGTLVVTPIVANRNIILTTSPQNPIVATKGLGVQHGNWSVTDDNNLLMTIRPNGGQGKNGLENARAKEIGFKVVHVRPNARSGNGPAPFINGPVGTVGTIEVRIYDASGKLKKSGYGDVIFQASVGRQIHITNGGLTTGGQGGAGTVSTELVEITNVQRVAPNTQLVNTEKNGTFSSNAPYAPRFLMFEKASLQPDEFIPQNGIADVGYVVDSARPWIATLFEGSNAIGTIVMTGPTASDRGTILPSSAKTAVGGNGSRISVPVMVGAKEGRYRVTISMNGGGSATSIIIVSDDDD